MFVAQETLEAWAEMGTEGGALLRSLGVEVADHAMSGAAILAHRNPVRGVAVRKAMAGAKPVIFPFLDADEVQSELRPATTPVEDEAGKVAMGGRRAVPSRLNTQAEDDDTAEVDGVTSPVNLRLAFKGAVEQVESGLTQLDWLSKLRFEIMVGLSSLFNGLNFFGLTEPLVTCFQRAALNVVEQETGLRREAKPTVR